MVTFKKNGNGTHSGLEETLWAAADKMRGHMDAAEYKHVVLGLIFLKYISDVFEEHRYKLQTAYAVDAEDPHRYKMDNIFWVPEKARWSYLRNNARSPEIGRLLDSAMALIEQENPSLEHVLPGDYARPALDKQRLGELVQLVSTIGLGDQESRSKDILGRVYEYFLGRFASVEGKGGEFYTPQSVVKLLVEMVEPFKGCVYDPCCGSGGMFVQSERFVLAHGGRLGDISIYGQELNPTTWKLGKMNLAIRGIEGDIGHKAADTFHEDLHSDLKADFILANPPFNVSDWGGERLRRDVRWKYGMPPLGNANAAWIQHIIHHLAPSGLAGFVLTNGSLFIGQGEGEIRKAIIENDLVDCIVALPSQLFYNTQIAACLWFLAADKKDPTYRDRKGQTLFIHADRFGKSIDRTHRELTSSEIERIAGTYHVWRNKESHLDYKDMPGFCKSATLEEIRSHNWALVPGRYVGSDESELPTWDMSQLHEEFSHVEARLLEVSTASESALTILKEMLYAAKPLREYPTYWLRDTLRPDPQSKLIIHVDSGGTPSTTNEAYWDGDIPWLTPKEITGMTDGIFVSKTERTITRQGLQTSAAKLLPVGTVMLTKRAPVGAVAINAVPMATNQGFLNFQCGSRLHSLYFAYWLRANKSYLDKIASGSTYPELYKGNLFEFEIAVPPLEEQLAILGVISALQYISLLGLPLEQSVLTPEAMIKMQEQNRRLRSIRDALVPKLLSGELDVSQVKNKFSEILHDIQYTSSFMRFEQLSPSLWT